jgi:hypothetical protein
VSELILPLAVEPTSIRMLVDIPPAEHFFSRYCVQLLAGWDFIDGRLSHNLQQDSVDFDDDFKIIAALEMAWGKIISHLFLA